MKKVLAMMIICFTFAVIATATADAASDTSGDGGTICTTCRWATENQNGSVCLGRITMCTDGSSSYETMCW